MKTQIERWYSHAQQNDRNALFYGGLIDIYNGQGGGNSLLTTHIMFDMITAAGIAYLEAKPSEDDAIELFKWQAQIDATRRDAVLARDEIHVAIAEMQVRQS